MKYFEKIAGLSDWIHNRGEDWDQLKYLAEHKYNVYKAGKQLDAPTWDIVKHDWSKFKPSIWVPYREKFFGGNEENDPMIHKAFRNAVTEHARLERHHDYKYNNPTGEIMPNAENLADWYAVSKSKNSNIPNIKTWLK